MVRPQETPPGHAGKLMRLPFTSFTARRKRALGFSRPSFEFFRKVLGHGLMPPEPVAQSESASTAALGKFEKNCLAHLTPVLSPPPFCKKFSPHMARTSYPPRSSP